MRRAVLIGNARSNHGDLLVKARGRLIERGIAIDESYLAADAREVRRYVKAAIRSKHELIIVGGGDGTMTNVVGCFAHKDVTLGVLPLGTGNSFALSLGIVPEIESAIETIVDGTPKRVDLGLVNRRYFANFSTIGLSADISGATPNVLKRAIGGAAYAVAGIKPLLTHRPFDCRIRWRKNHLALRTHQLIVANGRFFGDEPLLPTATIDDGELALFTTSGTSTWDVAKSFIALFAGKQLNLGDAHYLSAPKITVKTSPRVALAIDGDVIGRTPARFSVDRGALRVMVPA